MHCLSLELVLILKHNCLVLKLVTFITVILTWYIDINSFMHWVNILWFLVIWVLSFTERILIYCLVDILTATTSSILRNWDFPGPSHYRKENVEVTGSVQSLYLRKLKGELYILPQWDATVCSKYFARLVAFPFRRWRRLEVKDIILLYS